MDPNEIFKSSDGIFYPIKDLMGKECSFVGWTKNNKVQTFSNKVVDAWLINKYSLTHYMILNMPNGSV